MQVKKKQLEVDMELWTSSKLGKEYIMGNAGLDEAQLESILQGEILITSDMQMTSPLWQRVKMN